MPDELLKPARGQIAPIHGDLIQISQHLNQMKDNSIKEVNTWLPMLKPLFISQQHSSPHATVLNLSDMKELMVSEVLLICDRTLHDWKEIANKALSGTGLSLDEWQRIYESINQNEEPNLNIQQQQILVDKGILKMRLTFAESLGA